MSASLSSTMLPPFALLDWIQKNRDKLKPPVGNQVLFKNTDFIVMAVGGPNARTDYHVNEGEEFFYQIEGDIVLKLMHGEKPEDLVVRAGEIFILPPRIPHSPQRPAGSVGIVIERRRATHERDGFQWYCPSCNNKMFETFVFLTDIVKQLPPIFEAFYNNNEHCECKRCHTKVTRP